MENLESLLIDCLYIHIHYLNCPECDEYIADGFDHHEDCKFYDISILIEKSKYNDEVC